MKLFSLVLLCIPTLLGCSKKQETNARHILLGTISDPDYSELSVGLEVGAGKEIPYVAIFSDREYGSVDFFFDGKKVGTHQKAGVVMTTTGGLIELKGNTSEDLILIGFEKIAPDLFRITELERIKNGQVDLIIDHRVDETLMCPDHAGHIKSNSDLK